jgi:hypothetical protein
MSTAHSFFVLIELLILYLEYNIEAAATTAPPQILETTPPVTIVPAPAPAVIN